MDRSKTICFRVDARQEIGFGHLSRCLNLAIEFKNFLSEVSIYFISNFDSENYQKLIKENGFAFHHINKLNQKKDSEQTLKIIKSLSEDVDLVIVDNYDLDEEWETAIGEEVEKVCVIDDLANRKHACDFLIDQTMGRGPKTYKKLMTKETQYLLGEDFAIMDEKFQFLRLESDISTKVKRILVNFGGADPNKAALKTLKALTKLDVLSNTVFTVISGNDNNYYNELKNYKKENDLYNVELLKFTKRMPEIMSQSDLIIGAGGVSCYERCCLKKPSIVYETADNQRDNIKALSKAKAVINLGLIENFDEKKLVKTIKDLLKEKSLKVLSERASLVTDGKGSSRISNFIFGKRINDKSLILKQAKLEDSDLLYKWQSAPGTRKYALNPAVPSYEEHQEWYSNSLIRDGRVIYFAFNGEEQVAYIRLDFIDNKNAIISIVVKPELKSKGLGTEVLKQCVDIYKDINIYAQIKEENIASVKAFTKAGFKKVSKEKYMVASKKRFNENILVVVAHPDDEVLGIAGTLLKHKERGDNISILIFADGETSRDSDSTEFDIEKRRTSSQKVKEFLGVDKMKVCDYKDNQLDSYPILKITKEIENFAKDLKPTIVYTHFSNDLNIDHEIVSRATLTAFRPVPGSSVKKILSFETVSSSEWNRPDKGFRPDYFVDISNFIEQKIEFISVYEDEMREYPHARSYENIRSLATFRGSSVGVRFAEAFVTLRNIN